MPDSDLYVGLAGVAVVFAGFSGVSVVLTGRQPEQWRPIDAGRVSMMISLSIATAFFSLLPLVVARLVTSSESMWQVCSALFLVFAVAAPIRGFLRIRSIYRMPDSDSDATRNIAFFFAVALFVAIVLAVNVFDVVPTLSEGLYLLALVCYLGLSARMFYRTLTVLRTPGE